MSQAAEDARRNRLYWDLTSTQYDDRAAEFIADGWAWGLWQISEDELQILGDVRGADVLELGCGAAEWSRALVRRGARPVGFDNSSARLDRAREEMAAARVEFELVQGDAASLPFADVSFDIVVSDWGATAFADPRLYVPEVARTLRPGGVFAFTGPTPLSWICWDEKSDRTVTDLRRDLFGMHRLEMPEGTIEFNLPTGEWIRLFRANGLAVEDLIEVRAPEGATSPYRDAADMAWARRWPMEQIFKVRKEGAGAR